MTETTPRLGLPLLAAGQAQKEVAHNEALTLLDLLAQPVAETLGDNVPPVAPAEGQAWIVGTAPVGAWAGRRDAIALWSGGGWRFVPARDGMAAWLRTSGTEARFLGGAWDGGTLRGVAVRIGGVQVLAGRQPAIGGPSGGATVDAQARGVLEAVLTTLRQHGLIASGN